MVCVGVCGVHFRDLRGVVGVWEGLCGFGLGWEGFWVDEAWVFLRWFRGLGWDRLGLRSGVVGVSGRGIVSGHRG